MAGSEFPVLPAESHLYDLQREREGEAVGGDREEGTWQARYLWLITGRSFCRSESDGEAHGGTAKVLATGLDSGNPWP